MRSSSIHSFSISSIMMAVPSSLQTRFIDGHDAILQLLYLLCIYINARYMCSHFSEAHSTYKTYLACTYNAICIFIYYYLEF